MSKQGIAGKGCINNFTKEKIKDSFFISSVEKFYESIADSIGNIDKKKYLEISNKSTPAYEIMLEKFEEGTFLSNEPFESMLTYHLSQTDNKKLNVYNYDFSEKNFLSLTDFHEKFDFIFSIFGLSFDNIYTMLPQIIGFLKVGGILALQIPAYWYKREKQTDIEKDILAYSKQNNKKWLFTEPIEPIIKENKAEVLKLEEIPIEAQLNLFDLSRISSLSKLHDAIITENSAHLEIANLPSENIKIRSALIIIKKNEKTITKDNLFKI